jgi:hypothetical protein
MAVLAGTVLRDCTRIIELRDLRLRGQDIIRVLCYVVWSSIANWRMS